MNRRDFCGALMIMASCPVPAMPALALVAGVTEDDVLHCDFCGESLITDAVWQRPARKMYEATDPAECGLIVCEHCVGEYIHTLAGTP